MKLFITIALLSPLACFSQKLIENTKDEFTGKLIKRTSYERITSDIGGQFHAYVAFFRVDSSVSLDLKFLIRMNKYFSIKQGDKLMFKMKDGTVIELLSLETEIATRGAGSVGLIFSAVPGVSASYGLSSEFIEALLAQPIDKVRVYTSEGFFEKQLNEKFDNNIKDGLRLVK